MPLVPENAALIRVMVASPGDMTRERDIVESVMGEWNAMHSRTQQAVLLPLRWEYSAVPRTGAGDAQSVINRELVDVAHVLVTLFGHRIGTSTPRAVSGTVEEINEALARGVPVHVFFSRLPLPADVDTGQLEGVRRYERELKSMGLIGKFSSHDELRKLTMRCLVADVESLLGGEASVRSGVGGAILRVSAIRQPRGVTIALQNEGDITAESIEFAVRDAGEDRGIAFLNGMTRVSLGPGEAFRYHTHEAIGADTVFSVDLRWRESGRGRHQRLQFALV